MAEQDIKDLILARGRVQASLTRIQKFVQQYDETQDVLNIKLRMLILFIIFILMHF